MFIRAPLNYLCGSARGVCIVLLLDDYASVCVSMRPVGWANSN